MPRYKLTPRNVEKIIRVKEDCPCITNATLAYIFDISPTRVGEVLRDKAARERVREFSQGRRGQYEPEAKRGN